MTEEQATEAAIGRSPNSDDTGNGESSNTDDTGNPESGNSRRPESGTSDEPAIQESVNSEDPDTFPREYVEKLREENARYRTRATTADEANQRLLAATIASTTTGILADPTDLPEGDYLDGDGWPDPALIEVAAHDLVRSKPHLGDRRPRGSIGQGAASEGASVDLAGILRSRA